MYLWGCSGWSGIYFERIGSAGRLQKLKSTVSTFWPDANIILQIPNHQVAKIERFKWVANSCQILHAISWSPRIQCIKIIIKWVIVIFLKYGATYAPHGFSNFQSHIFHNFFNPDLYVDNVIWTGCRIFEIDVECLFTYLFITPWSNRRTSRSAIFRMKTINLI